MSLPKHHGNRRPPSVLHAVDIVPRSTSTSISRPRSSELHTSSIEGVSFAATFAGSDAKTGARRSSIRWAAPGRSGIEAGRPPPIAKSAPDIRPATRSPLGALRHPERSERVPRLRRRPPRLVQGYQACGGAAATARCHSEPRRGRNLTTERPQSRSHATAVYYPGLRCRSQSRRISATARTIAVEATIDTEEAGGVLFAQGSLSSGRLVSGARATRSLPRERSRCTSARRRSPSKRSRPSRASSRSPARG